MHGFRDAPCRALTGAQAKTCAPAQFLLTYIRQLNDNRARIVTMSNRLPRRKSTVSEIDAEIERLRERRKQVLLRENERFARAAIKAGLADLAISDDALDAAFQEIAARFRKSAIVVGAKSA
jgi:hypothetical protein